MLVKEFMRFYERRMMSLEWKWIKGRGRDRYKKDRRRIQEPKDESVSGGWRKYSFRISIICAYNPLQKKNCRLIKF
jgi:hypothetical protein